MNRQFLSGFAIAAVIMGACAAPPVRQATNVTVSTQAPASTAMPQDTTALLGVYTTTITKEDLSSNKSIVPADVCENAGVFTYTLSVGHWNLTQTAAPGCKPVKGISFQGSWTLSGNQISFLWDDAPGCAKDNVYTWKLDGTTLIHTVVSDPCAPRVVIFTTHPWVRQK